MNSFSSERDVRHRSSFVKTSKRKLPENGTFQDSFISFSKRVRDDSDELMCISETSEKSVGSKKSQVLNNITGQPNDIHEYFLLNAEKKHSKKNTSVNISEAAKCGTRDFDHTNHNANFKCTIKEKLAPIFMKKSQLNVSKTLKCISKSSKLKLAPIFLNCKSKEKTSTLTQEGTFNDKSSNSFIHKNGNNSKGSQYDTQLINKFLQPVSAKSNTISDDVHVLTSEKKLASIFLKGTASTPKNVICDSISSRSVSIKSHEKNAKKYSTFEQTLSSNQRAKKLAPLFVKCRSKQIVDQEASKVNEEKFCEVIYIGNNAKNNCELKHSNRICKQNLSANNIINASVCFPRVCHIQQLPNICSDPVLNLKFRIKPPLLENECFITEYPTWDGMIGFNLYETNEKHHELLKNVISSNKMSLSNENLVRTSHSRKSNNEQKSFNVTSALMNNTCIKLKSIPHIKNEKKVKAVELMNSELSNDAEELMWTEKYQPLQLSNIIGNEKAVHKLSSWLNEWKQASEKSSKCYTEDKDMDEWSISSDEELLNNCTLITGPSGSGKTSLVYSVAYELGFRVFEVNVSSNRSGRHIMSKLQEATQSHHVERVPSDLELYSQIKSKNKCLLVKNTDSFNDSLNKSDMSYDKKGSYKNKSGAQKKVYLHVNGKNGLKFTNHTYKNMRSHEMKQKAVICMQKKKKASNFGHGKNLNGICKVKVLGKQMLRKQVKSIVSSKVKSQQRKGLTISTLSVILFDDVDVVFEDDEGFWNAVNSFLRKTKKPVILTASRNINTVINSLNNGFETVTLGFPSVEHVTNYLTKICTAENTAITSSEITNVIEFMGQDIRKAILHLQFWGIGLKGSREQRPNYICNTGVLMRRSERNKKKKLSKEKVKTEAICEDLTVDKETLKISDIKSVMLKSLLGDCVKTSASSFYTLRNSNVWEAVNITSHYHNIGIDVIYNNLPNLLPLPRQLHFPLQQTGIKTETEPKESKNYLDVSWLNEEEESYSTCDTSKEIKEMPHSSAKCIAALKCVQHLAELANDISFADVLKRNLCKEKDVWSPQERLRKWNSGLPACRDENLPSGELSLELVSYVEVLRMKQTIHAVEEIMKTSPSPEELTLFTLPTRDLEDTLHSTRESEFAQSQCEDYQKCFNAVISELPLSQRLSYCAVSVEYLSMLRKLCQFEAKRQVKNVKRCGRFYHYLNSACLKLEPSIVTLLEN